MNRSTYKEVCGDAYYEAIALGATEAQADAIAIGALEDSPADGAEYARERMKDAGLIAEGFDPLVHCDGCQRTFAHSELTSTNIGGTPLDLCEMCGRDSGGRATLAATALILDGVERRLNDLAPKIAELKADADRVGAALAHLAGIMQ